MCDRAAFRKLVAISLSPEAMEDIPGTDAELPDV